MSTLSILPWNTCNAHCAHCGPDSGPKDKTRITRAETISLIEQAGSLYKGTEWCLSLSGGEIFLHYDELLEYSQLANSLGGYTTLITNCFWARTVEVAEEMLRPLKEANLKVLGASVGEFHREYIPINHVANAIKAARSVGILPHIRMASTKKFRLWQIMQELEKHEIWFVDFMEMPVTPAGRAAREVNRDDLHLKPGVPKGGCPAAGMTINPSGNAMVCCNGAGEYGLDVGSIREYSLENLNQRMASSLMVDFLVKFGPSRLLELLPEKERQNFEVSEYVSVCHLCFEIFADPTRHRRLNSLIEQWYRDQATAWMPGLSAELEKFHSTQLTKARIL
jgi:organic radical activating enzyme